LPEQVALLRKNGAAGFLVQTAAVCRLWRRLLEQKTVVGGHEHLAAIQVVDPKNFDKVVEYGQTGRVLLTTLTKEFFVPRFAERDEGERELPFETYPWDGVSGVRPFSEFAATTVVGVY
jgi:hypothetical protein